jgi:hypothetical protein
MVTAPVKHGLRIKRSNRPAAANRAEETLGGLACCGKVESGAAKDRCGNGANCPRSSVVLGDVIDIGESAWRFAAAEPISRLRE